MLTSLTEACRASRSITEYQPSSGAPIVYVSLQDGTRAVLDAADFHHLMALGISPNWRLEGNGNGKSYVRASPPSSLRWKGNALAIGRTIMLPDRSGVVVRYRDGDPRNLRRSNLELVGRKQARAYPRERYIRAA